MTTRLDETNKDAIKDLLTGRRVQKIGDDELLLDDGTVLTLTGHEGRCSCGAGDYDLVELNGVDNVITNVEFEDSPAGDDTDGEGYYRIFVYAGNERINLAVFEGTDGNGYYGTGYWIAVKSAAATEETGT
jgi:hypothetical protein